MRIHLLSDVHLEARGLFPGSQFTPAIRDADVTVLAGDIHMGEYAVHWARAHFPGRVLLVAGNHEHWGGRLQETVQRMREASCERVRFLEQDEVVWEGVRFLGATCWTDYEALGNPFLAQLDAMQRIRDFQRIRFLDPYGWERFIGPQDLVQINQRTKAWLQERLSAPFEGPTVVVSHHAPLSLCGNSARVPTNSPLHAAYVNHWPNLLGPEIPLWLYGHTHFPFDQEILGTRVVSNPMNYPGVNAGVS
jgi:predicted phosphodiesterase